MKAKILYITIMFLGNIINAQINYYHYSKGDKDPLVFDKHSQLMSMFGNFDKPSLSSSTLPFRSTARKTEMSRSCPGISFCSKDSLFYKLWGLNNFRRPSVDINICDAWKITEGKDVKVAIFGAGIELTHKDLADNIFSESYDAVSQSSPSQVYYSNGTNVAGVIAAVKDNGTQVVGVAPKSTLISISSRIYDYLREASVRERARGINWAWQNGADIINNSWVYTQKGISNLEVLNEAIRNALSEGRGGKGTVIVFNSGNHSYDRLVYPANSNPDIITVGAIDSTGIRYEYSNYGDKLDVVAPGVDITTTTRNNSVIEITTTDMAAAYVSGVAALMLSINPYLTAQQVSDIIEKTAQKIRTDTYSYTNHSNRPNGTWNNEMGYGLVDAYAAVKMAQRENPLDLYIRDSHNDLGEEPNLTTTNFWHSPDIWLRRKPDGVQEHQRAKYDPNNELNYIYVRIINRGSVPSTINDQVAIYWRKKHYPAKWPGALTGLIIKNGVPMGGLIGVLNIPILKPGRKIILQFPWSVPNPDDYANIMDPNRFGFLARILSDGDPMANEKDGSVSMNMRNNNNIAYNGVSVNVSSRKKRKNVVALEGFETGKAIEKIIPNPVSNTAQLTYQLNGAKSAYLMIAGFYHGAKRMSTNYALDVNKTETTLDLTNYSNGYYQVALVCDGKIADMKTLIKE